MAQVEQLKAEGNKHFAAGQHAEAIKAFSAAIALAPENHILFSNRSAAHASLKDWDAALQDAEKCVALQPSWGKGYSRLGAALHGLGRLDDAVQAYERGLKVEPGNDALKKALDDVRRARDAEPIGDGGASISSMFTPASLAKIATDPRTSKYMSDPSFNAMLRDLQRDPKTLNQHLQDPRMMDVLSVIMNINVGLAGEEGNDQPPMDATPSSASASRQPEPPKPAVAPTTSEPAQELGEEDKAKRQRQEAAAKEKELGTAAYKKRAFEEALAHYTKASEIDPDDIAHLNNISAVHLEAQQYQKCIDTCQAAVEKGRELRADFKLIARALGRIGTAYAKLDNLPEAIKYFNKSLTEHRTPDILDKLREAEKLQAKREREAYINPELAHKERERGNDLFKHGDFPEAIKAYGEAIKRNPTDPRNLTNRAAAFAKIMAYNEALRDCDDAIAVDATYAKAYVRKAAVLLSMKKYNECLSTLSEAEERDTDHKNETEINQTRAKATQGMLSREDNLSEEEVRKRAAQDPEVQQIMSDPVMRSILEQMQNDPQAVREHLKNPMVARKLQKLIDVGIIRFGSGPRD